MPALFICLAGLLVKLKHPYPVRKVKEPNDYEEAIFTESLDVLGGDAAVQQQVPPPLPVANSLSVGELLYLSASGRTELHCIRVDKDLVVFLNAFYLAYYCWCSWIARKDFSQNLATTERYWQNVCLCATINASVTMTTSWHAIIEKDIALNKSSFL